MTEWRNELLKDIINAMYKVENMQCSKLLVMARAALAVAEPVIREQCAQICERRYMGDNTREDMEAKRCAAAVREGGEDRYARG
jgi:hypothetical protein